MAASNEEEKHICRYAESHEEDSPRYNENRLIPPSPEFARKVALAVLGGRTGRYRTSGHFRTRMRERAFDVFDIEYVIRHGKCSSDGFFSEQHKNHKYTFRGDIDGISFDAVFGLSSEHDLIACPVLILITGCFKTKSGKRSKT